MDTQPVSIFVTGFVPRPGNYTGTPSDTILAFLDKAGGIDSKRGSYRNIRVLRQGQEVGSFDLYPFALKGAMPHIRFQDGDTVVVGEKGPSVITSGEVRNTARFDRREAHRACRSAAEGHARQPQRIARRRSLQPVSAHERLQGVAP